jgi:hypothetical protein
VNQYIKQIIDTPRDYANGSLELASMLLEAWAAGLPIEQARPYVVQWIASIEVTSWAYRRSPSNPKQSSHDEWLGLCALDAMFKLGISQKLLDGPYLWITGCPHDVVCGIPVDSEWLTPIRPEYRGIAKFVIGRESWVDRLAVHLNLRYSNTFNLLRIRLLLLSYLGIGGLESYQKRLSDRYKGRYGDNPVYNKLWELNNGNYHQ